ncbi:uncharacterized protein LOC125647283 [Ostrea edulis]|uniref:uncharacterized protein LOC125647283 n=1 Tax=Ostrea edulis TaxID=37623 RepID=UPI0024AF012F|nr:uncharacterized protein LOC125647283 [Ostrea edulis]
MNLAVLDVPHPVPDVDICYGTDASTACPTGQTLIPLQSGQNKCVKRNRISCSEGFFFNNSGCDPCPLGRFQPRTGTGWCDFCPVGTYQDKTGQISCALCEDGTYQNETGSSECRQCPLNDSLTDGGAITNHQIGSVHARSEIGCAMNCLRTRGCYAISYDCKGMTATGQGLCNIMEHEGSMPYTVVSDATMCFMKVRDRYPSYIPITEAHTMTPYISSTSAFPQLSSTTGPQAIIDMVDRLQNMCTATTQSDIAVITGSGTIYIYDDYNSLTTGSCKSVDVTSLFDGYSDLPHVSQWKAVYTVQKSYVDVYTGSKVYRWAIESTKLRKLSGYPKSRQEYLTSVKGSNNYPHYIPENPAWAVHRETLGALDIYFYERSVEYICYYSNQMPKESRFHISDTSNNNQNGNPINPWIHLPVNTVALTAADNIARDFVGITEDLNVVFYTIKAPFDLSEDPTVNLFPLVY